MGVPTGSHGAFRDYQVDAITLKISPKDSPTKMIRRNDFILRGGRYVSLIQVLFVTSWNKCLAINGNIVEALQFLTPKYVWYDALFIFSIYYQETAQKLYVSCACLLKKVRTVWVII